MGLRYGLRSTRGLPDIRREERYLGRIPVFMGLMGHRSLLYRDNTLFCTALVWRGLSSGGDDVNKP